MKLQVVALVVCCVLGSCWAQGGWDSGVWSVYDFPDPILTPAACGRPSPSFVCDPNNILPQADGIHSLYSVLLSFIMLF